LSGRLVDVSEQGVRLLLKQPLPPETVVHIEASFEGGDVALDVIATVRWSHQDKLDGWLVGCNVLPSVPEDAFDYLAENGNSNRRLTIRNQGQVELVGYWDLDDACSKIILQDYSHGGFRVLTSHPGKPGQRLHVSLGGLLTQLIVAEVRWRMTIESGHLIGCQFLNHRDHDRLCYLCELDG
jgi:hypothetical protein